VLGEGVVAEVRLRRARGDDQRVVRHRVIDPGTGHRDRLRLGVHVLHPAEPDVDVLLLAQHLADRRRDLALGQDPGRDLIEQRLEQVVRGAVDQRDLDRRVPQRPGREQPAEPRPDDHHTMHLTSP
jgi:hypothetical protein